MKCYVCGEEAIKYLGRSNLCAEHRRFVQMQKTAKQDKKYIPSIYELQRLAPKDMKCGDCGIEMNWIDGSKRSSGAVLQHYRDGTLGITCLSCNTKHGLMHGDSYRDLPKGHKLCRTCKTIKPLNMFGKRSAKEGSYPKTKCKACEFEAQKVWRLKNPEGYKKLIKKHNDIKKLNPEKYRDLDKKYYHARKEKNDKISPAL
jgi:hypothetical protein